MKMSEYLSLTDDEKMELLDKLDRELGENGWLQVVDDRGKCSQCGKEVDVGDYCFGCHQLVCLECVETEPHLSNCYE